MVAPNNEIWQWDDGYEPFGEGEINNKGTFTFIAMDDIQKYDIVTFGEAASSWKYGTPSGIPKVYTVGAEATNYKKPLGIALNAADSGENVAVRCFGETILICKTTAAITGGYWVRGSKGTGSERKGCVYQAASGDTFVIGIALNTVSAPSSAGSGTVSDPYNCRPVAVLVMPIGDEKILW